jgi:hypothetical protein
MRFFNTEGPVNCADHYCLPPLSRLDLDDVLALIAQKKYFLLYAPRQTGKTSCLLALAEYLNRAGDYYAVYANIETAQALREDVAQAMTVIVNDVSQLLLQAFLQRILNGGGRIDREYGLGRRCTDLLIVWPHPGGVQHVVIELKLLYTSLETTLIDGLAQTWAYADACGADEAHLVIFDRTPGKPWAEKIWQRQERYRNVEISVWGM